MLTPSAESLHTCTLVRRGGSSILRTSPSRIQLRFPLAKTVTQHQGRDRRAALFSGLWPRPKETAVQVTGRCPEGPQRREGDGQDCGVKESRPRDRPQIGIIILKVTVIIASIYLAPIKYQSLGIHLFLPKLWKVATGISAVQMRRLI